MDITLEDSTTEKVSPILYEIIKKILSESKSTDSMQKDFLFVVIVVVMIENGFLPIRVDGEKIDNVTSIDAEQLAQWKSSEGFTETVFVMKGFESIFLKLIMSPLGATVLVNLIISELNSETYSVCLPVSRYVVSPQASTIPMIFRDLKHLSTTFKNKVVSAVKSKILTFCGYPSASLIGVPEEVFSKIVLYLPIREVINLSKTCKRFQCLIEGPSLWMELYKRDFSVQIHVENSDWKKQYRETYIAERERLLSHYRQRAAGTMHDLMDYSDLVSYIDNPLWDNIVM